MQLTVADIRAEGTLQRELSFEPSPLLGSPPEYILFKHPVHARIQAQMTQRDIYVTGEIDTIMTLHCARCLEKFEKYFSGNFSQSFQSDQKSIDLTDDIRETVLIDLPIRGLCRENCLGLCQHCGTNLNQQTCHCGAEKAATGRLFKDFPFH